MDRHHRHSFLLLLQPVSNRLLSGYAILVAYIVMLIAWLAFVRYFFDCGWLKALAISIIAVVIAVIVLLIIFTVLTLIGVGTGWLPIRNTINSF